MIFLTETKCKIRFIYVGVNCKIHLVQALQRPVPPWRAAAEVQTSHLCGVPILQGGRWTTPLPQLYPGKEPGFFHPGNSLPPVLYTRRVLLDKSQNSGSLLIISRGKTRRAHLRFRNGESYFCYKEKCTKRLSSQTCSNHQPQS